MLPTYRPNSAKVVHTTKKVGHACVRLNMSTHLKTAYCSVATFILKMLLNIKNKLSNFA